MAEVGARTAHRLVDAATIAGQATVSRCDDGSTFPGILCPYHRSPLGAMVRLEHVRVGILLTTEVLCPGVLGAWPTRVPGPTRGGWGVKVAP